MKMVVVVVVQVVMLGPCWPLSLLFAHDHFCCPRHSESVNPNASLVSVNVVLWQRFCVLSVSFWSALKAGNLSYHLI